MEQYYLCARYYNPVLGRFMQEDTYWGDGLNLYAYCKNNPVIYYDPSGYAENCHQEQTGGTGGNNGDTVTTEEVVAFGNATEPRGARPKQDFHVDDFDNVVGPESGSLPLGASTFDSPSNAPITGRYYKLPKGTELPDGLAIIAYGIDVNPESPHGVGHHTIFPTKEMTVEKFNELLKSLPWLPGGKKG